MSVLILNVMAPPRWSNHSSSFPPRCEWNPQWAREQQQQHHQQFAKYKHTQPRQCFGEDYWCETCDRGFAAKDLLDNHKQQHQKCNIDGCQFVAHPKVITKHIQMQHSTGLFKKIANLNKPEDIQKWITERKKRYPTKTNVEKKEAERKEKIERGEKIGLQHSSRNDNFRQGTNRKRKPFDGEKKSNQKSNKDHNVKKTRTNLNKYSVSKKDPNPFCHESEDSESRKLKHFTGIRNLIVDSENEESKDPEDGPYLTDDEEEMNETAGTEPKVCDALVSLISNYDNSSEEDDITNELDATITKVCKETESQNISQCSNKADESIQESNCCNDGDSGPEEVKNTIDTIIPKQENSCKQEKIQGNKKAWINKNQTKRNVSKQKFKTKVPSTLLQRLLFREIQQERNIILQCVNYIVKMNFFDKLQ